ncbi:SDR family NAD(P)-dependent oxidoreductase [Nocardia terpenica]|nr:SDR family NAD(P)-dependent oxidoreductase [Nocardia terpenica]MBF6107985.1 SDR family NAD(P)-dependent oxidoreductase [Nocardia terpenica]MBF6115484.1 SDR family NAD(P)-dependent oxidoreductase [Nocardia terpenica]MBF6121921.1 SDR family NAD(P)-dependent oxidoreductase [Nocardia terpenica]MBF6155535.1 SDR family NAD(P)-dependent oxidoreductase [Nocardia terpenica]
MEGGWAVTVRERIGRALLARSLGPVGGVRRGRGGAEVVVGKRILLTGASAGVGRAAAVRLAGAGAEMVLVARRGDELERLQGEIRAAGGKVEYRVCDLSEAGQVEELVRWVVDTYGGVDVLINNAARSIRRPLTESFDRLHDYHRTMAVNYFGAVQLTLGLLPHMIARGTGHVINVGTWTVAADTSPWFTAYHASKAALAGFGRAAGGELERAGIAVTSVHYPLVHTAMSAPTEKFRAMPGLTPEQAAEWLVTAIRTRPVRMVPQYAAFLRLLGIVSPRTVDRMVARGG